MLSKTARADDDRIVLGRWEAIRGRPTDQCRWCSFEIKPQDAPWSFPGGPPLAGQCRFGTRGHGRLRRPLRPPAHRWEKGAVRSAQGHAAPCGCLHGQQGQRLCSGPVPLGKAPAFLHCHGIGNAARGSRSVDGPPLDPFESLIRLPASSRMRISQGSIRSCVWRPASRPSGARCRGRSGPPCGMGSCARSQTTQRPECHALAAGPPFRCVLASLCTGTHERDHCGHCLQYKTCMRPSLHAWGSLRVSLTCVTSDARSAIE